MYHIIPINIINTIRSNIFYKNLFKKRFNIIIYMRIFVQINCTINTIYINDKYDIPNAILNLVGISPFRFEIYQFGKAIDMNRLELNQYEYY